MTSNNFPDPVNQTLSGNTITLTTGDPSSSNREARWLLTCLKCNSSKPCCNKEGTDFAIKTTQCSFKVPGGCIKDTFCTGDSEDCPNNLAPNTTQCSVKVPGGCIKDSYCTGDSEDCPNNRRVNGVHCQWHPSLPRLGYGYTASDNTDQATVHVSAEQAAAWLTGVPAYDTQWPKCAGRCHEGLCALRRDHPACCYVPHSSSHRGSAGRPYSTADDAKSAIDVHTAGYRKSRDFFCWK